MLNRTGLNRAQFNAVYKMALVLQYGLDLTLIFLLGPGTYHLEELKYAEIMNLYLKEA